MGSERIFVTDYYDNNGKIILPDGIIENPRFRRDPSKYLYEIPDAILNRPDSKIKFKISKSPRGGVYEWYKPKDSNLDQAVIVARPIEFKQQRIVGPVDFIDDYIDAYSVLDDLFPNYDFHQLDIVASIAIDTIKLTWLNPETKYWNFKLLKSLNIDKTIESTQYKHPDENKPSIGIYADVKWPCFFEYYYIGRQRYPIWIIRSASIVHEFTHRSLNMHEDKIEAHQQEVIAIENDIIMMTIPWTQNEFGKESDYWLGRSIDSCAAYMNEHLKGLPSHFAKVEELTEF